MAVLELTQDLVDTGLICPPDKSKVEFRDTIVRNLMAIKTRTGNVSYVVRYRANGKYQYITIGSAQHISLDDVRIKAKEILSDAAMGKEPENRKSIPTFSEYYEQQYLPHKLDKLGADKETHDRQLYDAHLKREFGHITLDKIKLKAVEDLQMHLYKIGRAASTCNKYAGVMKHSLNLAVKWGIIAANPLVNIQQLKVNNEVERYMNSNELERMILVLNTHDNRMVSGMLLFMLSTGCRRGEAFRVKWEDIDMDKRIWMLRASTAKSGKRRSIPLSDSAMSVIDTLDTRNKFEYLFVNKRTGDRYKCIKTTWNKIRQLAGVPDVRLHDLRHQFASLMANGGRSLYEVQKVLGHSDPKVTMRYAHLQPSTLNEAVNSISSKLTLTSTTTNSEVSPTSS